MNDKPSFAQSVGDFLVFRRMLGTNFIKLLWVIGAIWLTVGAVALVLRSLDTHGAWATWGVVLSIFFVIFGNMVWRLVCEIVMAFFTMFFAMQESLMAIDKSLKQQK